MVDFLRTEDFYRRIEDAQSYYRALHGLLRANNLKGALGRWRNLLLVEQFALLHPEFYKDLVKTESVLGPRTFLNTSNLATKRCMCDQIWGYECEFVGRPIHLDHKFPYSLGGATDPDNLLLLCDIHNLAKGHDIHIYPWPTTTPAWVERSIERLIIHYPGLG